QPVTVHWFFGVDWSAPTVIVVLTAFALGSVVGVLAMLPSWWRHRCDVSRRTAQPATFDAGAPAAAPAVPEQLRRDGL
ncbi:MAG: lipopolysaccharide assembly protein LapA domain-containing protein, partial [Rubrivivax sp.]